MTKKCQAVKNSEKKILRVVGVDLPSYFSLAWEEGREEVPREQQRTFILSLSLSTVNSKSAEIKMLPHSQFSASWSWPEPSSSQPNEDQVASHNFSCCWGYLSLILWEILGGRKWDVNTKNDFSAQLSFYWVMFSIFFLFCRSTFSFCYCYIYILVMNSGQRQKHTLSHRLSLERNENANHPIPKRTCSCAEGKNGENNRSKPVNFFFLNFIVFIRFSLVAVSAHLLLEILHFIHTDEIFMAIFLSRIGFYSCWGFLFIWKIYCFDKRI